MKIVIFGSGISGLTVAHEMIEKGFEVIVYEKDTVAGGMARSFRYKNGVPTEHSWRGYAPFYYNTFEIMKRIPLQIKEHFSNQFTIEQVKTHNSESDLWTIYKGNVYDVTHFINDHPGGKNNILKCAGRDITTVWKEFGYIFHIDNKEIINIITKNKVGVLVENFNNNTVLDNLNTNKLKFKYLFNKSYDNKFNTLSFKDLLFLFFLFGRVICSNKRRHKYFNIKLEPIIKKHLSKSGYIFIADFLAGPGWGFDKKTMSLGHYATFVEYALYEKDMLWQVMKKPTSEAWIDPWVNYLKSKGVKFYFSSELTKININQQIITNCIVKQKNETFKVNADIFVCAINPFNFENILKESNYKKEIYKSLTKSNIVNNQISFRLGFNKKINFGEKHSGFVLVDSPYNITFYPQEDSWDKDVKLGMDGKIKTLISGTLILPYNKGILYKKSATSLKINELKEEIIQQFMMSESFRKILIDSDVTTNNIIFKEIFSDWYENNNFLKNINKKWVNNAFNEKYRLDHNTPLNNLFITGSHCKTSINIWSMEGAVESGKICSNLILKKNNMKECFLYTHKAIGFIKVLQYIEDIFYNMGLKNILVEIIFFTTFYFIYLSLCYFRPKSSSILTISSSPK